ncbi:MAG: DUF4194 domain-containing protein [Methylomonas sp.]|nr:DUF4194 domain-containing protein [Methylomonas sp.]PPD21721.1 MAG: hypothetical protein CTY23_04985 [Methylomonas sp.]PPD52571.1 MAG: hypothetical protein CTY11_08640 [Methylomonas sp.]
MTLTQSLLDRLQPENLKLQRFQEIVARLFAWGIIVRDEDGVEQRCYDDACRIENLLVEYFALAGFRLIHDLQNEYFRLYAPGAQIPGMVEDDVDVVASLRARLSADFVAAALALRFLYQQGLVEGGSRLSDAGEILIRFDELATTLQTQIKRTLPDNLGDRERLLKDLKRHRLIQYNALFSMHDEDALIAIRPTILGIISEDVLAAALEAEGQIEVTSEPDGSGEQA